MTETGNGSVIVAGAGPGVSGSLARLFGSEGRSLGLLGVDEEALTDLAMELREAGAHVQARIVDLTDDAAARAAVTSLGEALGPIDVVHFNPSAFREKDPLHLTPDELAHDVALGVGSLLTVVQAALPFMHPGSRVTVTGSMAADKPWNRAASLGVQKAGLRNLVKSLDDTLAEHGIRAVTLTVNGTLAKEGKFSPDQVAAAIRAAVDQPETDWQAEVPYGD